MRIFKKSILVFALLFVLSFSPLFSLADSVNYPLSIIDNTGTIVNILQEPQRIISTSPENTEILFALGLKDKIVGITNYCNFPEETKNIEKIGEMSPLNLEKIVSLKPDFILAYAGFQLQEIPRLRKLGFNVLVIEPLTIKETLKSIKMVATVCGIPEKGNILLEDLSQRVDKIKTEVSKLAISNRPKVFIGGTYETIYTPGEGTLFNELITLSGGENIAASLPGWVKISPEFVAEAEPEIIIIPIGAMNPGEESKVKENISNRPGWSNIPAIKTQSIFIVNEDLFYRAGPRLVDGLELLYEIFHK
ncbi:MAG: cobalamin-binding protein [Candidatus Infernicultor aquiphilus]|uniref:Cobalamin-binding protein n=1 Tax=Candidatus Infernicultor aquiphilus TaxID=1805029 RepID=A0A1J5GIE2_9BACT|nr:ABC transporter substrate-binding protein [bacterium]OIP72529.1 MAG: cobalamin-binding protein [Candidatus Atribacteria bacterium CG2_30_33_13]PIU24826.1 MAG: cobalamin-binding protein [Candidatus Atribacteria bacterium CG08_land_8_20_14_0_20_33_29]PIW11183.1 MAG: cobalamin-binding protein [Candidatus Atribacteria bacterium CG17_big_fil_post_rev_8_21_14_2_50_34_11]PIX33629.1 MAG: cobalamin-binding protein [Candidatus Atribacteria bacterium CG_4_8_14_3_um_filter_34_18]PIY33964.1 MAG: cobalam